MCNSTHLPLQEVVETPVAVDGSIRTLARFSHEILHIRNHSHHRRSFSGKLPTNTRGGGERVREKESGKDKEKR